MQPKHFTLERRMKVKASSVAAEERAILRIDREALKSDVPKIRFAVQS